MSLAPGVRLGVYDVLAPLGAGGMGEVYRARDPRLGREVAIKVLPSGFSTDPDRLHRFEQEARAAAALNHPNILAVYDIGSHDGVPYIVSELLQGKTLRDRLSDGAQALPVRKAVEYTIQIARGLTAAHDKGIVHRDLKPDNAFVTTDERVKILDFGLAKLAKSEPGAAPGELPTAPPPTEVGAVLGTVGYMSPEQVRGLTADHRSDIFSLGAILYELLSGRQAFRRDTGAETMTAILKEDPPDLPVAERRIPPGLARIVGRCLEKNPAGRFQTASDLVFALEGLSASADSVTTLPAHPPRSRRRERVAWFVAVVAVVAAIAAFMAATLPWRRDASELQVLRLEVTTPPTSDPTSFALSPDGRQIVFVAAGDGGSTLWLRPLDQTTAQPLPGTRGATFPFWSPDSRAIGFFADAKLKRLDLPGGKAQELADASNGRGGAWSRDGVILFAANVISGLLRVPATGGTPTSVTRPAPGELGHRFPEFLPDGRRFIFWVGPSPPEVQGLYLGSLDAPGKQRLAAADAGGTYAHPGYLLWPRQGVLVAALFDAARGALSGEPIPIAPAVGSSVATNRSALSASTTGLLAYRTGVTGRSRLVWMDRRGTMVRALGSPDENQMVYPEPSPDGQRIAVQRTVQGNVDIWQVDATRGIMSRFTFDTNADSTAVWAPDGSRLIFRSNRNGVYDLFEKPATGAGDERRLFASPEDKIPSDWSADGRFLLFASYVKNVPDLWALPIESQGVGTPFPVVRTPFAEDQGQFSPDGRWIAYRTNESGQDEIYVQAFPGPGGKLRVSAEGGSQPRWRRDGKELFYIAPDNRLMAVAIGLLPSGQTPNVGAPVALFSVGLASRGAPKHQYAVAPDGQRFLMIVTADETNAPPITIIQNWMAGLKK
jgi:eukaryotic-like serine/threonine-protein kinase